MNADEHRAEAARLLDLLDGDFFNDAQWHQAVATRALAHATLAGLLMSAVPVPRVVEPVGIAWPPPWKHDEDIVFQGPAAAQRVECQRLAREEYTKRHAAELIAKLSEEH